MHAHLKTVPHHQRVIKMVDWRWRRRLLLLPHPGFQNGLTPAHPCLLAKPPRQMDMARAAAACR